MKGSIKFNVSIEFHNGAECNFVMLWMTHQNIRVKPCTDVACNLLEVYLRSEWTSEFATCVRGGGATWILFAQISYSDSYKYFGGKRVSFS